ncbi:hypothetical protein ACFV6F_08250 [Kitasatospora phosalacinea]|uniref:hypothetical protein n=1 Tax=Kitasatospora phosalacinea TaxID=2065 RepID=UPI003649E9BB
MSLVLVHGIFNHVPGATPEEAAGRRARECRRSLEEGLDLIGLGPVTAEVVMAYYADLLRREPAEQAQSSEPDLTFDHLSDVQLSEAAEWLYGAGAPALEEGQNLLLAPVRQILGWLVGARGGDSEDRAGRQLLVRRLERVMVSMLKEVEAYTAVPGRREAVQARVAEVIRREHPRVVVAHSLGSIVAYETLHAHPELEVELLVTVGSPLRVPIVLQRLVPPPQQGRGAKPAGVARWVNIADVGDLVAVPPKLSEAFPVDQDETVGLGLGFHGFGSYLSNGLCAAAIAPYLF